MARLTRDEKAAVEAAIRERFNQLRRRQEAAQGDLLELRHIDKLHDILAKAAVKLALDADDAPPKPTPLVPLAPPKKTTAESRRPGRPRKTPAAQ